MNQFFTRATRTIQDDGQECHEESKVGYHRDFSFPHSPVCAVDVQRPSCRERWGWARQSPCSVKLPSGAVSLLLDLPVARLLQKSSNQESKHYSIQPNFTTPVPSLRNLQWPQQTCLDVHGNEPSSYFPREYLSFPSPHR